MIVLRPVSLGITPPRAPRVTIPAVVLVSVLVAMLGGCASSRVRQDGPPTPGSGPDAATLAAIPDAVPRVEPVRSGGPNKPYRVLGRDYVPLPADAPYRARGLGSWYGRAFHGRPTASGESYDMYAMTAAHATLPIPSYVRVTNPANGRSVIVRINDRGPFAEGRIIDLSYAAAARVGILRGVTTVEVERIGWRDIESGAWQRSGDNPM